MTYISCVVARKGINFAFVLAFCASVKEGWLEDPTSVKPVISVITDFGQVREFTGKKNLWLVIETA